MKCWVKVHCKHSILRMLSLDTALVWKESLSAVFYPQIIIIPGQNVFSLPSIFSCVQRKSRSKLLNPFTRESWSGWKILITACSWNIALRLSRLSFNSFFPFTKCFLVSELLWAELLKNSTQTNGGNKETNCQNRKKGNKHWDFLFQYFISRLTLRKDEDSSLSASLICGWLGRGLLTCKIRRILF